MTKYDNSDENKMLEQEAYYIAKFFNKKGKKPAFKVTTGHQTK